MGVHTVLSLILVSALAVSCGRESPRGVADRQSSTPDAASEAVRTRAEKIGTSVLLILREGRRVFQFGDITRKYMCDSIRKPFLGCLYGIYRDRGITSLDLTLAQLGIDDVPRSLTDEEKRASIRDLLMSRSGVYHEAGGEARSMIDARPPRGSHKRGTFFYYNNWDFNALGTIFEQLTGQGVFDAFHRDIAVPIGMEDFSPDDCTYVVEPEKSMHAS
jgi:CubicO group peptidase (beta-lactamase class C family)